MGGKRTDQKKKKAFKMPHTLVIIFMIILRRSCLPGSCRPAPMCVLRTRSPDGI